MDLLAVIVNCPFGMSVNFLPVSFDNDIACKVMRFLALTTTCVSACTILVIAVQRYLKICRPLGRQMTRKWKKLSIFIVIVIMVIASSPCLVLYGSVPVLKRGSNLVGLRCSNIAGHMEIFDAIFKGTLFLIAVMILVGLIVLYSLIGRVLYRQTMFADHKKPSGGSEADTSGMNECTIASTDDAQQHRAKALENDLTTNKPTPTSETSSRIPGFRLSIIFMVIAVVYCISNLPVLLIMTWECFQPDFWQTMSNFETGIYRFLYLLYIINNIANPFIYGFLDKKFQTELKKAVCRRKV